VVRRAQVHTPTWFKSLAAAVPLVLAGWLALGHHDRMVNQERLGRVASEIAGRPVRVRCPGVVGRILSWDTMAGTVAFDASGHPADVTKLRAGPCAELDALAEGRRRHRVTLALAMAVGTLAHESFHLRGIADEGLAECGSLQVYVATAERLGAAPDQARALAELNLSEIYPFLPDRYRTPPCTAPTT
jgi:hypothetical protein